MLWGEERDLVPAERRKMKYTFIRMSGGSLVLAFCRYVQFKKVPGGTKNESCIVNGVVCSKNVAHRTMPTELASPRILLLGCSIVYQRIEGRLLSLEPVMMQVGHIYVGGHDHVEAG
jgi:hypothetical protein